MRLRWRSRAAVQRWCVIFRGGASEDAVQKRGAIKMEIIRWFLSYLRLLLRGPRFLHAHHLAFWWGPQSSTPATPPNPLPAHTYIANQRRRRPRIWSCCLCFLPVDVVLLELSSTSTSPLRLSPRPSQPKPVVLLQEFLLHTPIRLAEERIGKKLQNLIYHRFDHNTVKQWTKR